MAYRWKNTLTRDDATPEAVFMNRRQIIAGLSGAALVGLPDIARAQALEPNSW